MIIDNPDDKKEAHQEGYLETTGSSVQQGFEAPPSYEDARSLPPGSSPYAHHPSTNPFVQQGAPPPPTPESEYPSDAKSEKQRLADQERSANEPTSSQPDTPEPSSSSTPSASSSKKKLTSSSQLLNPPPPSFQRAPPQTLPYGPFPPTSLLSHSSHLDKGFPLLPPPASTNPHAFVTHDVNEEDWKRFVGDVVVAAGLSTTDKIVSQVAPIAMGLRFIPIVGLFVSKGMEAHMKSRKSGPVADIIDHWNHYFFHPRQLEITLAQGRVSITGPNEGLPADILYRKKHKTGRASDDDYSSDTSSDSDLRRGYGQGRGGFGVGLGPSTSMGISPYGSGPGVLLEAKMARRTARRERRMAKRAARMERRGMRRDFRDSWDEKYRLVVSYKPWGSR